MSGLRTCSENVADITGLIISHDAYVRYVTGPTGRGAPEDLDDNESRRFLLEWASMWRAKFTPRRTGERLIQDRHTPAEFRCNGPIGHLDGFYRVFGVSESDRLYIEAEKRFSWF